MIKNMSSQWKTALRCGDAVGDNTSDIRAYLDPRGIEYAPIAGTEVYYTNTSADPVSGEYSLSQSTCYTPFPFSYPITFECLIKPGWAYNVASDQEFCRFYSDTYDDVSISFCYYAGTDQLGLKVYHNLASAGGGAISQTDAKLTKVYTSNALLQQWIRLTGIITEDRIYILANGNDTQESALAMSDMYKAQLFSPSNNVAAYINYVLIMPGYTATTASTAAICNYYEDVANEQIYFDFQQKVLGKTRCNVTKPYLKSYGVQNTDGYAAAVANISLASYSGEFADDQYAAYAPESGSYNGLVTQKYLTNTLGLSLVQKSRQKPQINNTGSRMGYWSFDQALTDYPDTASPTYFQPTWATTDSWVANANPPLTVGSGYLIVNGNQQGANYAININGLIVKAKIVATQGDTYYIGYRRAPAGTFNLAAASVTLAAGETGYLEYTGAEATDILYIGHFTTEAASEWFKIDWVYIGTAIYATLLRDESGNANHGALRNILPVAGKHGNALLFSGGNLSAATLATATLAGSTGFTLGFWAKENTTHNLAANTRILMVLGSGANVNGLYISAPDSSSTYSLVWCRAGAVESKGSITLSDTYSRIIITYTVATKAVKAYTNGVLTYSNAVTNDIVLPTGTFIIGSYTSSTYLWHGYLDEVFVDKIVWTADQVANDYAYQTGSGFALTTDASEEQIFHGTIDSGGLQRSTSFDGIAQYTATAEDFIKNIARKKVRSARVFDSYYFARATPSSNSLWHEYAWMATKKEVYNYLGNSGFENDTIANSWISVGTDDVLERSNTVALQGTYAGYLHGTDTLSMWQEVTIGMNKYDVMTFQIYAYCTAAQNVTVTITEYAATVAGTSASSVFAHAGKGCQLCYVKHTITDAATDTLRCTAAISSTACRFDMAMLTYGDVKYYYINNANDGTAGVIASTLAQLGTYHQVGLVTEDIDYQHPWAVIARGESPWDKLKGLMDAGLARFFHSTRAGVYVFRSYFETADETTSRGVLPTPYKIEKVNQPSIANRITIEGVYIEKQAWDTCVWDALSAGIGNEVTDGSAFGVVLANGEFYPDATELPGGLECLYEDRRGDKNTERKGN